MGSVLWAVRADGGDRAAQVRPQSNDFGAFRNGLGASNCPAGKPTRRQPCLSRG